MTTNNSTSARRTLKSGAGLAMITILATGLAGCETGGSLFGSSQGSTPPELASAAPPPPPVTAQPATRTRISIAPVIGAPEGVARQMQADWQAAAERQKIIVAPAGDQRVDYTLRGYIVAAKEKTATKVSYIWDVTDPTGKRVNRITGEEIVPGNATKDPWASVTPALTQAIAEKSASSLSAWLPGQNNQAAVAATPAAVTPVAQNAVGGPGRPPVQQVAARGPATASIVSGGPNVAAIVPSVVGAPGDGSASLTRAIQSELTRNGVSLADQGAAEAYRIEGKVVIGKVADGKQPIQIDWMVRDPQGKRLGTVSQKNDIPAGSLDGAWGQTADAAAAAAAQGIIKLLPNGGRATN